MAWVKSKESHPPEEGWYWIFIPPTYVERAWYDPDKLTWCVGEGAYFHDHHEITHWQPYFTPAIPGAVDKFLKGFRNDV